MTRTLIFAPNGGAAFSSGGGVKLCLSLGAVLREQYGREVAFAGYLRDAPDRLRAFQGVDAGKVYAASESSPGLPFKVSAYAALLVHGFPAFVQEVIRDFDPDEIWFNDDIPVAAREGMKGRRCFLYVHFPFAARTLPYVEKSRGEAISEWVVRRYNPVLDDIPPEVRVLANSAVTAGAVRQVWGRDPMVLPPYIYELIPEAQGGRLKIALSLGAIQAQKRHLSAYKAFRASGISQDDWKFIVMGHSRDARYERALIREGAEMVLNPERQTMLAYMAQSTIVVNAATFEPFGLTTCEAMAAGCHPLVRASESSGSWTDIAERGRYAVGFADEGDLAQQLRSLAGARYLLPQTNVPRERAATYSREAFAARLSEALA